MSNVFSINILKDIYTLALVKVKTSQKVELKTVLPSEAFAPQQKTEPTTNEKLTNTKTLIIYSPTNNVRLSLIHTQIQEIINKELGRIRALMQNLLSFFFSLDSLFILECSGRSVLNEREYIQLSQKVDLKIL